MLSCLLFITMFWFLIMVNFGPYQGPAQSPYCNRYTDATVEKLLQIYPNDRRMKGEQIFTKMSLIVDAYHASWKTI